VGGCYVATSSCHSLVCSIVVTLLHLIICPLSLHSCTFVTMFIKRDLMLFVEIRVVKTLSSVDHNFVVGLTLLGVELFVLYRKDDNQVVVYSAETSADYEQLHQFSIHDYQDNYYCDDMTSCERHKCLYILDMRTYIN